MFLLWDISPVYCLTLLYNELVGGFSKIKMNKRWISISFLSIEHKWWRYSSLFRKPSSELWRVSFFVIYTCLILFGNLTAVLTTIWFFLPRQLPYYYVVSFQKILHYTLILKEDLSHIYLYIFFRYIFFYQICLSYTKCIVNYAGWLHLERNSLNFT